VTLLDLILGAVADAVVPGVTGAVVSGGIDSSTIVSRPEMPTFTGYYEGEAYDERRYARLVAGGQTTTRS
jgi:asparagine synthetase B (glutamine-hydrolysing)